jgi:hypothetical protein
VERDYRIGVLQGRLSVDALTGSTRDPESGTRTFAGSAAPVISKGNLLTLVSSLLVVSSGVCGFVTEASRAKCVARIH